MHLNMEGTKHEKVVLVILAYVIGFTAGFITFGLSMGYQTREGTEHANAQVSEVVPIEQTTENHTSASKETSNPNVQSEANTPVTATTSEASVGYQNGRLFSNLNGASVVLSVKSDQLSPDQVKEFGAQGTHDAIPKYLVSGDSNFIYFCEQKTEADTCNDLVYDVKNEAIHFVRIDSQKLTSTSAEAKSATWDGAKLIIAGNQSISESEPWKLAKTN